MQNMIKRHNKAHILIYLGQGKDTFYIQKLYGLSKCYTCTQQETILLTRSIVITPNGIHE